MRGNGTTVPHSQNGGKQRTVEESAYFKVRCKKLAPYVPRLREILTILRRQLAHYAEGLISTDLGEGGPGRFVAETPAGEGAPALYVFFSLTPSRCVLAYLAIAGWEPPSDAQDETIL